MWNCRCGRTSSQIVRGQRLLSENAFAGGALNRSFQVPESGETVGGNARVMNQSCPVRDVSKQHAYLEVKILFGSVWVCHLVKCSLVSNCGK